MEQLRYRINCKLDVKYDDDVHTEFHSIRDFLKNADFYSDELQPVLERLKEKYDSIEKKNEIRKDEFYVFFEDCVYRLYDFQFIPIKDNEFLKRLRNINSLLKRK